VPCPTGVTFDGTSLNAVVDPVTGAILFDSGCDLVGSNLMGQQLYAVRPDGTGLRQLTNFCAMTVEPDGTVDVELPGPFAYSMR
jgi:hypothetical protein